MANTRSAAKRARQTLKRTLRNRGVISRMRNMDKRIRSSEKVDANQVRELISSIDNAAKRGIIHRNAAIRRKARLNRRLASAGKK